MRFNPFLAAHGYDPGPTQRPILAGLLAGSLATAPSTALLLGFGSVAAGGRILGLSQLSTLAAGLAAMAVAGAGYGAIFRRAANDRSGAWLFGMAYGFLLWVGGAVMLLPAMSGGAAPAGEAATGIMLALLLWGTVLGAIFPIVHRAIHLRLAAWTDEMRETCGPSAAAAPHQPGDRKGD
jgi:hypothetical protein